MVNKDFLKQILSGEKELIPLKFIRIVDVPAYDELSVKNLWPDMKTDKVFMKYFPEVLPKDRLPSREYFFNVLHTCQPEYVQALIMHANE